MKKIMETIAGYKALKIIAGILLGAVGGFLYYKFIGCSTGACPLTSNPYISTLIGAIMGLMIAL